MLTALVIAPRSWLYNMLLSVFSNRVRGMLRARLEQELKQQLSTVLPTINTLATDMFVTADPTDDVIDEPL